MNYKDKFLRYFLIFKNKIRQKLLNFYFSFFLENFKNDSNTDYIDSFINTENKQSKNIINLNILEEKNNFFPFLISNNFLKESFYRNLNKEVKELMGDNKLIKEICPNRKINRSYLLIDNQYGYYNFKELKKRKSNIYFLYKSLDSFEFRAFLYQKFHKFLLPNGFIVDPLKAFMKSNLYLQYCEANSFGCDEIHIERRTRVVHGHIFFGGEGLKEDEFTIHKHKKLKNIDYKQIAREMDIIESKNIAPTHNKGLLILSTPNSYYKGKCSEVIKKYLYWGYTMRNSCWINSKNYKIQ